jgi:GTP cyclohydrolase I
MEYRMTPQTFFTSMAKPLDDFVVSKEFIEQPDADIPGGCIPYAVKDILHEIGEDPEREGLLKTPERVARMYAEITAGYRTDPEKLINGALFDVDTVRWCW